MNLGGNGEQLLAVHFLISICMLNAHPGPLSSYSFASPIHLFSLRFNKEYLAEQSGTVPDLKDQVLKLTEMKNLDWSRNNGKLAAKTSSSPHAQGLA